MKCRVMQDMFEKEPLMRQDNQVSFANSSLVSDQTANTFKSTKDVSSPKIKIPRENDQYLKWESAPFKIENDGFNNVSNSLFTIFIDKLRY